MRLLLKRFDWTSASLGLFPALQYRNRISSTAYITFIVFIWQSLQGEARRDPAVGSMDQRIGSARALRFSGFPGSAFATSTKPFLLSYL
jgi:hypothetical protein